MQPFANQITPKADRVDGARQPRSRALASPLLVGLASALIAFIVIFAASGSADRTGGPIALQLAPESSADVSAVEGDRVLADFVLRNNSNSSVRLVKLSTSCPCLVVESPATLPLDLQPSAEVRIRTGMTAEPAFAPVQLELRAVVESSSGTSTTQTAGFLFQCRSRFRATPSVVTFGPLERADGAQTRAVTLFADEGSADTAGIDGASAVSAAQKALSVEWSRAPAGAAAPSHYRAVGTLMITFDPGRVEGPFRGEVDVAFRSGGHLMIPVTARVQQAP